VLIFLGVLMKKLSDYFTKFEIALWICSIAIITLSFLIFDRTNPLNLVCSLLGATSLIFCAKGNPIGNAIMVVFSILYAIISYTFKYYGEMFTYLFMTLPMSIACLVSWLKNPFKGNKAQVKIADIKKKDLIQMIAASLLITLIFYFILKAFNTANLIVSTISIATSFFAAFLTYKRSPYFALAYAANDLVLIVLWIYASLFNTSYASVAACFITFFINDIYGFINWLKMKKTQGNC
jgi:nicotinamide mononucleotide transporter PnuC